MKKKKEKKKKKKKEKNEEENSSIEDDGTYFLLVYYILHDANIYEHANLCYSHFICYTIPVCEIFFKKVWK